MPVIVTIIIVAVFFLSIILIIEKNMHYLLYKGIKKMCLLYKHVIALLITSIIFAFVSYDASFVMNNAPSVNEVSSSVIYILLIFFYGIGMGINQTKDFILFITTFWGIGAFLFYFGYFIMIAPIFYTVHFIFSTPVYSGVIYIFGTQPFLGATLSLVIPYIVCLTGYAGGKFIASK